MTDYQEFSYFCNALEATRKFNTFDHDVSEINRYIIAQNEILSESVTSSEKLLVIGRIYYLEYVKSLLEDFTLAGEQYYEDIFDDLTESMRTLKCIAEECAEGDPEGKKYAETLKSLHLKYTGLSDKASGPEKMVYVYLASEIEHLNALCLSRPSEKTE